MFLPNVNMLIYQILRRHIPVIWKPHVLSSVTCSNKVGSDCKANFQNHQILMWLSGANFLDYFLMWMYVRFCMSFVESQTKTCPTYTAAESGRQLREINPRLLHSVIGSTHLNIYAIWQCLVKIRLTLRFPRNPPRVSRGSVNTFL